MRRDEPAMLMCNYIAGFVPGYFYLLSFNSAFEAQVIGGFVQWKAQSKERLKKRLKCG